jgi:phosphatidylethanolamine/phosphatidyl-N-methylethanolamine N-methyltransferase
MSRSSTAHKVELDSRRVERVYSVLARVYDDFFDWALGPGRVAAVRDLDCRPDQDVLEVGVGTGLSLPQYPRNCRVTGVDISTEMLRQARARAERDGMDHVRLLQMDARQLAFPDASFDRVLAPYVISVVPEPERVMAEIARVCRPGGTVVVVNHFRSTSPILGTVERALTPASQWVGFRMDLPVDAIVRTVGLRLELERRVNLMGLWRLLRFRREESAVQ